MKRLVTILIASLSILLIGCSNSISENSDKEGTVKEYIRKQNKNDDTDSNESKTKKNNSAENDESDSSAKETSDDSDKAEEAKVASNKQQMWNDVKAEQLATFMSQWGDSMGQHYKAYDVNHPVDLYGLYLPQGILAGGGFRPAIGNTPIVMNWSDTGESANGYSLVAVYSDADEQDYLEKHVYFFTIVAGVPKVLLTMQNQGNEYNYLYLNETANPDLRKGFNDIIASPVDETSVKSSFTRDELLSFFIARESSQLPYAGNLSIDSNNGSLRYYIDGTSFTTKESIQTAIEQFKNLSLKLQDEVASGIPLIVRQDVETAFDDSDTVTVTDGDITQANHPFGRVIQGFD
ncbi:MAG TPA: DUF4767 domain-containing protein [Bavariicoccus seileri]|uniref:DUF4767 domain-containing protein n=1 Tax=Bavariicoccus seileri TaxID=549685 RepID=A0A3D4S5S4_9ENTE|nr:DUF4767 domain-containing protein [Bavariicoccus seileri]HCS93948.1 DUF4767 domain-containing protein [Bavariicoccus seileri]